MEDLLRKIGLGDKEIQVFLTIVRSGSITASEIADITTINRTTVYAIAKDLLKLGIIGEDLAARKHTFIRLQPESLQSVLEPLKREMEEKEKNVQQLMKMLEAEMKNTNITLPKVVFIHQDQIESYLYTRTPIWNQSILDTDAEYTGFLDYTFTEIYHEWITWYWGQPSSKHIHLRLITNESDFEKNIMRERFDERRKVVFWEGAGEITYNTWTNGNFTLLINTRKRPFYLIEIYDENFARSQRQIFEALWGVIGKKENQKL